MITAFLTLGLLAASVAILVAPIMVGLEYLLEVRLNLPERPVGLFLGLCVLPALSIGMALGIVHLIG
jgi:hypothetical protein